MFFFHLIFHTYFYLPTIGSRQVTRRKKAIKSCSTLLGLLLISQLVMGTRFSMNAALCSELFMKSCKPEKEERIEDVQPGVDFLYDCRWAKVIEIALSKNKKFAIRHSPKYCAGKRCEKAWRTANRSTLTIEKSTPDHSDSHCNISSSN